MDDKERIAELEEEIAYLKSELGLARETSDIGKLSVALKLTKTQANFLSGLYNSRSNLLNKNQLYDITRTHGLREDVDIKVVDIQVCKLRRVLGKHVIETVQRTGYRLTPAGVQMVEGALK